MNLLIVVVILLCALTTAELIARRWNIPDHLQRKILHVGMAIGIVTLAGIFGYQVFTYVGLFFTLLLIILRLYYPLKSLRDRSAESYGEIFFPLGVFCSAAIAENFGAFAPSILIMGLADTAAYFVGTRMKSQRLVYGKTVAGSFAFFVVALFVALPFTSLTIAILIAIASTAAELLSTKGSDNLTVPLVISVLLVWLQ